MLVRFLLGQSTGLVRHGQFPSKHPWRLTINKTTDTMIVDRLYVCESVKTFQEDSERVIKSDLQDNDCNREKLLPY